MKRIRNILLKGLAAVLPTVATLYIIYWLGTSAESVLKKAIESVLPEQYYFYFPGMGLAALLVLLFALGLLVDAWLVKKLLALWEKILERIPFVKTVYRAIRDFTDFVTASRDDQAFANVVMVSLGDIRLLGFVTSESLDELPEGAVAKDTVSVYLPMSFQMGGYTLYLPRSQTTPVDMPIEEAMRLALTAGLSKAEPDGEDRDGRIDESTGRQ